MELSVKVLDVLSSEGISFDELEYMVQHAAITSLRDCNRRYFQWLFRVVETNGSIYAVQDMQYASLMTEGQGESRMLEEHLACEGAGCRGCGWVGQISRGIRDTTNIALTRRH